MIYRHTQTGWLILTALLVSLSALVVAAIQTPLRALFIPMAILFLALTVTMASLTVTVEGGWLEVRFGRGPIRRRIALADIRAVRRVRNRWLYGWGIRLTPHGWLWNIAGLDAVELDLEGGRRFRIGTDEPDALIAALRFATAERL